MHFRAIAALVVGALLAPGAWGTEITHDYTFGAPSLSSVEWGGVSYTRVTIDGATNGGNPGEPRLPGGRASILIPYGEVVTSIQVTGDETLVGTGYVIEPVGKPFAISVGPTSENIPQPDPTIYNSSDPFPATRYVSRGTQAFRGYDILMLRLEPTKYIPTTGALYHYPALHVVVQTQAGSGRNTLLRGLTEDKDAAVARVDNPGTISTYPATQPRGARTYQLLIVTTSGEMEDAFEDLQAAHGLTTPTMIVTVTTPITWQELRTCIKDHYESDGILFALIGGDDDVLPAPKLPADGVSIPADFYLGCLARNPGDDLPCWTAENPEDLDMTAEVYIGRAAADSPAEVTNFVNKTVAYLNEQHAHLGSVLQASEVLSSFHYGKDDLDELIDESIAAQYRTLGIPSDSPYTIDELYDAGGPYEPQYRWPVAQLLTRMDAGVHWINHLAHGSRTKAMKLWAAPYATTTRPCGTEQIKSDIEALTTTDYFFVYSQSCHAGWFDGNESVAETLTTKTARGAFAVIMNGRSGWGNLASDPPLDTDGPSQRYHRLFWNGVFNQDLDPPPECLTYGAVNQWSKEAAWSGWADSQGPYPGWGDPEDPHMRYCFYELNLFGDPSLLINMPPSP